MSQRLLGNSGPLFRRHKLQGPHIVQTRSASFTRSTRTSAAMADSSKFAEIFRLLAARFETRSKTLKTGQALDEAGRFRGPKI